MVLVDVPNSPSSDSDSSHAPTSATKDKGGSQSAMVEELARPPSDDRTPGLGDRQRLGVAGGSESEGEVTYRLYRRRFAGVAAIMVLNIVGGMNWPWFGPISDSTSKTFGISFDQVNWLGNIIACTYLVVAPIVPIFCARYGLRACYVVGACSLLLASWIRVAGTAHSLDPHGAYALLIIGQFFSAIAQASFQVLAPKFSETWFDEKGRTTATMLMSIANPVGGALGQLISPLISGPRKSILVLGIISTIATPCALAVGSKPPTPPSYAGSQPDPPFFTTLSAILGLHPRPLYDDVTPYSPNSGSEAAEELKSRQNHERDIYMSPRERVDFVILFLIFGVLVAGTNTFAILSAQILTPYGYSEDTAGFMGAALLLSGIVAAIITSPLFDRIFTHHLGLAARIFAPVVAVAWLALIWAVRPHNTAALFAVFVIIGVFSVSILPVGLELGCELTRNSSASAAILWWSGNLFGIIFVLIMSALRASTTASPPQNMHRSLIFNGSVIFAITSLIFVFRGQQRRREKDVRMSGAAGQGRTR